MRSLAGMTRALVDSHLGSESLAVAAGLLTSEDLGIPRPPIAGVASEDEHCYNEEVGFPISMAYCPLLLEH